MREDSNNKTGVLGCSGFTLKMIALITMLIDHVAATIVQSVILNSGRIELFPVYELMRYIGRMAFPIYCFLLVEGFIYTKNLKKYAFRLFLFALISEIPFDLAFSSKWIDMSYNNVFFTLLIGLLVITGIRKLEQKLDGKKLELVYWLGILLLVYAGMILAEFVLHTDYGASGIIAIVLLYLLRKNRQIAFLAAVIALTLMAGFSEIVALLMLVPILRYNGTRGKQIKYLFYVFYPAHLLILGLICKMFLS